MPIVSTSESRSAAARKAWQTRRQKEAALARSAAARKAWQTRRSNG